MAFSGSVSAMGLDQVIGFLAKNALDGVLIVTSDEARFELFFDEGRILFPIARRPDSGRLPAGDLAALRARAKQLRGEEPSSPRNRRPASGRMRRSALHELLGRATAVSTGAAPPPRDSGKLSRKALGELMARAQDVEAARKRSQLTEEVEELFRWSEARFTFEPGKVSFDVRRGVASGKTLCLDTTALLMELARRADEVRRYPVRPRRRRAPEAKPAKDDTRVVPRLGEAESPSGPSADARLLAGDLEGIGLAAVLQALRDNRHTGTLEIRAGGRTERVLFSSGEAFLLRARRNDGDEFVAFFLGESGARAVNDLAQSGIWELAPQVAEASLSSDEQREMKEAILDLLFFDDAEFAFRLGELPSEFFLTPMDVTKVALHTERFLYEAIGQMTRWDWVRRATGGNAAVLQFASAPRKLQAVRDVADWLTLVDGRLTLDDLVRASGHSRLVVGETLAQLMEAGALRKVRRV